MKAYKIEFYFIDREDWGEKDIKTLLESQRYITPDGGTLKIQSADIGEWHDDHELNFTGGDFEKYFKKDKL